MRSGGRDVFVLGPTAVTSKRPGGRRGDLTPRAIRSPLPACSAMIGGMHRFFAAWSRRPTTASVLVTALVCLMLALIWAPEAGAVSSPGAIIAKGGEREADYNTTAGGTDLAGTSVTNILDAVTGQVSDLGRLYLASLCANGGGPCAGDVRLNGFEEKHRGLQRPVLFTARNGSTISGHVWATKAGPAKRPLIVITNGSLQAPEQAYWWAAQTLAKAGYVVLTSDPAGQGRSDLLGTGADLLEGVHSQVAGNTFYDGTQDALDFALSTPTAPFCPRPSRGGTSHCDKQRERVAAGLDAPHNPLWNLVDPTRVGLAGHSYGAAGVSLIGQQDRRVDAVVAWDRLCDAAATELLCRFTGATAPGPPAPPRVPSLGLTGDSLVGLEPTLGPPADPAASSAVSRRFSAAGVDSGSISIRGGTHFEFSYLPLGVFRATRRGIDLTAWYTLAWFDKYVKQDPTADARLLSDRWRRDPIDAAVDPAGGGNLLSDWSTSRLDVRMSSGSRSRCEDLRSSCAGQTTDDRQPRDWGYLKVATSPDGTPAIVGTDAAPATTPLQRLSLTVRRTGLDRTGRALVRVTLRNRGTATARATVSATVRGAAQATPRRRTLRVAAGRSRTWTVRVRRSGQTSNRAVSLRLVARATGTPTVTRTLRVRPRA